MPQIDGPTIRARAARLREVGSARVAAHLAAMQGRQAQILLEKPGLGRTEGFALARLRGDYAPGDIVPARITGQVDGQLTAEAA